MPIDVDSSLTYMIMRLHCTPTCYSSFVARGPHLYFSLSRAGMTITHRKRQHLPDEIQSLSLSQVHLVRGPDTCPYYSCK